jgi:hypothetical protein
MLMGSRDSLTRHNRFLQDRYGLKGSGATAAPSTGGGTAAPAAKDRSIAAAMALPMNNGKTKAEVEADLKKYGYNPVP